MMLRPRQTLLVDRTLAALDRHGNTLAVAPTGCHAAGTAILLHDGTIRPVEEIVVGDRLMGTTGSRLVLELHRGRDEMFEIRPMKGDSFVVNAGHVLTLVRTNDGNVSRTAEIVDIPLVEYLGSSVTFRHLHKLFRVPADFPAQEAPSIDPYFLGVLLGDGCIKYGASVTTPDVEIAETVYAQAATWGLSTRVEQIPNNLANT